MARDFFAPTTLDFGELLKLPNGTDREKATRVCEIENLALCTAFAGALRVIKPEEDIAYILENTKLLEEITAAEWSDPSYVDLIYKREGYPTGHITIDEYRKAVKEGFGDEYYPVAKIGKKGLLSKRQELSVAQSDCVHRLYWKLIDRFLPESALPSTVEQGGEINLDGKAEDYNVGPKMDNGFCARFKGITLLDFRKIDVVLEAIEEKFGVPTAYKVALQLKIIVDKMFNVPINSFIGKVEHKHDDRSDVERGDNIFKRASKFISDKDVCDAFWASYKGFAEEDKFDAKTVETLMRKDDRFRGAFEAADEETKQAVEKAKEKKDDKTKPESGDPKPDPKKAKPEEKADTAMSKEVEKHLPVHSYSSWAVTIAGWNVPDDAVLKILDGLRPEDLTIATIMNRCAKVGVKMPKEAIEILRKDQEEAYAAIEAAKTAEEPNVEEPDGGDQS